MLDTRSTSRTTVKFVLFSCVSVCVCECVERVERVNGANVTSWKRNEMIEKELTLTWKYTKYRNIESSSCSDGWNIIMWEWARAWAVKWLPRCGSVRSRWYIYASLQPKPLEFLCISLFSFLLLSIFFFVFVVFVIHSHFSRVHAANKLSVISIQNAYYYVSS